MPRAAFRAASRCDRRNLPERPDRVRLRQAPQAARSARDDDGGVARPARRGARSAHRRAGDGGTARRLLSERADARQADAGHRLRHRADWRRQRAAADRDRVRPTVNAPGPIGVVAHYNLLEQLEPAGPGDLYRARDTRLGRTVALRLLPADFTAGADSRTTLVAQARAMTVLSHP